MADSTTAYCRKCLAWVSRIGPTTPAPPASTTGRGDQYPVEESSSHDHDVATAVVIISALAALVGMIVITVLLRRKRIRGQRFSNRVNSNAEGAVEGGADVKGANGDAAQSDEGKWSAEAVELVVMAGETTPTFVAHPVPAPTDTVVVQCPPFSLPKDPSPSPSDRT